MEPGHRGRLAAARAAWQADSGELAVRLDWPVLAVPCAMRVLPVRPSVGSS